MRHTRLLFLLPVLVLALFAAGCGGGGGGSVPGGAIAKVGSITISKGQFDALMNRAKKTFAQRKQPFPAPASAQYATLKSQAVQFLVQRAEYSQEAGTLGITISQKQIDDRLSQIKKQYFGGDEKRYKQQLKTQGITQAQVESDIKDQLIAQAVYNKVTEKVKVSPQDVTNYYNSHKSQYHQAESRDVRHILIAVCGKNVPGGAKCYSKAKAKALADRLYSQLQNGANFAALAKKYSGDPGSAAQGGKLTISKGQTVLAFDTTAFNLGTGTISHPVETQYGFHIIQPISAVKPPTTTPLSQVRASIEQLLLQQKKQQVMSKWISEQQKKFNVSYSSGYAPATTSTASTATGTGAYTTTTG